MAKVTNNAFINLLNDKGFISFDGRDDYYKSDIPAERAYYPVIVDVHEVLEQYRKGSDVRCLEIIMPHEDVKSFFDLYSSTRIGRYDFVYEVYSRDTVRIMLINFKIPD